jgi:hypothetical protein
MRKILYSPGYGAGWSSWSSGDVAKFMLEYKPIIDDLEAGRDISKSVEKMQAEIKEKFNKNYVCVLGANTLRVAEVRDKIRIIENDGYESIEEEGMVDYC